MDGGVTITLPTSKILARVEDGIGWLIFNSIKGLDYPVIQGGVLLIIIAVAIANFAVDSLYPLIDPRIRYQSSGN